MSEYSGNFDLNTVSSVPRWFGRVVSDVSWQENIEDELFSEAEQQKGWGYRYRIRYFGLHSANTQDLPDEQLPMANVVMPVTAGSGLGGFHDTPALSSGTIVTGWFLDGMAGQEPYIDGVLINSNNDVPKEQPKGEIGGGQLFNQTYKEGTPERGAFVPTNLIGTQEYWKVIQSIGDKIHLSDSAVQAWTEQDLDRKKPTPLASPCKTDNSPFKGIQTTIQNLLNDIKDYDTIAELFGGGDPDREKFIQKVLDIATGDITGYVKSLFDSIRGYAYNVVSDSAKKVLPFLFPSEMPKFMKKINEGTNLLSCLFNKLVRQLPGLIGNILSGLLDKLIDTAFCFVESFVSDLLNNFGILDQITNAVQTAIALFSQGVGLVTGAIDSIFNALDFANGILNFFKCDDDAACPQQQEINLAGAFSQGGDPQVSFDKLIGPNPVFSYGSGNGSSSNQPDYSTAFK
jgi:hypothetical protein